MTKAVAFFSGAGGLDIGIHEAGFDIRASIEIEKLYCKTLKDNNPSFNVINGDIMDFDKNKVYDVAGIDEHDEITLMFGGSPCQTFSTAGKRQGFNDKKGAAMLKFAELVADIKPKGFLLENVRGLLSASLRHRPLNQRGEGYPPLSEDEKKGSALKFLLSKFEDYNVKYKIINSAEYGVPQKRERVFFIGIRKDIEKVFEFPDITHNKDGIDGKKKFLTFAHVNSIVKELEPTYVKYSEEREKYMKLIPMGGGNWRDLDDSIAKVAMGGAYNSGGGKTGYFRRVKIDEPTPTLLTSPIQKSTNLGHPLEDRPLSIEEYLIIQGFGLDYKVAGSTSDKYTQIGNAVPVNIGRMLGEELFKILNC